MSVIFIFCLVYLSSDLVSSTISPNEAKLRFYYGPSIEDFQIYNLTDINQLLEHPNFRHNTTHFYIHGYIENQDSESVQVVVDAYLKQGSVNILVLDWAKAAAENYFTAVLNNVPLLAPVLADMFLSLYNAGIPREKFSVVGHSLGAQLAGQAGRQIMRKTDGQVKIYRMIALDAAFPLFPYTIGILKRTTVNKHDAEHLQAIHTSSWTYGQPHSIGHIDFWPNGGTPVQPGCPTGFYQSLSNQDLCSHQRSWRFWAESVANEGKTKFLGYPASSYLQFVIGGGGRNKAVEMGYNCPIEATGDYYLKTNKQSPFAMGAATVK